jgi:hypothetical protein
MVTLDMDFLAFKTTTVSLISALKSKYNKYNRG